ncbi:MAG TPA: hypothetical protein VEC36_08450 [Patescibacteria group bacterium]|nr:hypothetical protein [Patescibacteria group bacterium]
MAPQFKSGLAYALCFAGNACWRMSRFAEALEFLKDSFQLFEKLRDHQDRLRVQLASGDESITLAELIGDTCV